MKMIHGRIFCLGIGKMVLILAVIAGLTSVNAVSAQVANYAYSQSTGTYTVIPSPTTVHASGWDDARTAITIPFTFNFNGTGYTACSVNTNGYITFGATLSATNGFTPISSATGYSGAVAAFGRDLISNSSTITYGTDGGVSPNRVFIIQWNNARRYNGGAVTGDVLNFQIRLYETSNKVEVRYGTCTATNATALTSEVGLRGSANADFNNLTSTTSWATVTQGTTTNTNTVTSSNTIMPASGLTYIWTPPNTITTTAGSFGPYCNSSSNNITLSFSQTGNFTGGQFNIQVSNSAGVFPSDAVSQLLTYVSSTSTSVTATLPAAFATGTGYRVRVVNNTPPYHNSGSNGSDITVISSAPSTPGAITGSTSPCASSTGNIYSISAVSGAASYTWSVTGTGWSVTAGGSTTTATITAGSGAGTVNVTATNSCGTSAASTTGSITPTAGVPSSAPTAAAASLITSNGFTANWGVVASATSYNLDVYTLVGSSNLATWTFPTDATIVTPSLASTNNTAKTLTTNGGTIVDATGATTRAPSANAWNAGSGSKAWQILIDATGFSSLKLSSKQRSSNADGPRDFKVQYKLSAAGTWTDVTGGTVSVANDFTTGVLSNLTLPSACDDQATLYIRWIMTSNTSVSGGTVMAGGTSRIDDISVIGDQKTYVTGFQNLSSANLSEDVSGLPSSTTYNYVVRATNSCGSSANSNQITVTTDVPCTPTAVITSFSPATGPAGTLVTITGTGFTGATKVKFGSVSVSASLFTVVSSTKIIAEVPSTAPTDKISVTVASCDAISSTNFTPITQSAACGNVSGYTSDVFISEIYDAFSGSLSYIEIFNGTAATVNLATGNYVLRILTGTSTINDISLSGTIASGATYIVRVGTSSSSCTGFTIGSDNPSTSGFNGNDRIYLRKNGVNIDYAPNPSYPGSDDPGFSQSRKATAVGPTTTYSATDWTVTATEDCSTLGIAPYTINATSVTVGTQPQDENDCSAISFTVGASSNPSPVDAYAWKYFNTAAGTWDDAANITNAATGITASATTSLTMTITGNTAQIIDYQFFCEVTKNSCTVATNAVQYTYNTRLYYRNISSGNWSNPVIWQMSSDSTNWSGVTGACMYPIKENSSGVFIQSPYTVTQDVDINIDYLYIKTGAILTTSLNSQLIVSDSTAGADFIVGGTWNYDANAASSLGFDLSTGRWQLGSAGSIVKTNTGDADVLRDYYEGGMSAMTSTANWTIRYTGAADVTFTTVGGTYYPNLTFESNSGLWAPVSSTSRFTNNTGYATVYGNLNIGGSGTGTVTITNENTNAQPLLVNGTTTILANNTLTTAGSANGTGYELKGNLTVSGTLTAISSNVGLLKLSATTGTQTVSGTGTMNLQHVTAANTGSTILLNKDITIPGILTSSDGSNLNLNTGNITMKSTDTGTARVAPVNTGVIGYGTGQFIIERNVDDLRSWRLLSIPVVTSQTMRAAWMEGALPSTGSPVSTRNEDLVPNYGTHISGPSPLVNGFDETPLNNYSVKYYNGTGWVGTGIQPDTSHLRYKAGWMLFVRGPRSYPISTTTAGTTPQVTTLRLKGQIYVGTQPTITPSGYTVVGNPYASAVNFSNVTKAGPGDIYYIWDPRLATNSSGTSVGGWVTCVRKTSPVGTPAYSMTPAPLTAGMDSLNGRIESGAAIVVNNINITSLHFKEGDKSGLSALVFRPHGPAQQQPEAPGTLRANLYVRNADGTNALFDGVMHLFGRSYNSKVDGADALKLITFAENLGILSHDSLLAVEKRNILTDRDTLQYWLKQLRLKNYSIEFAAAKIAAGNTAGYVEDRFLQTSTPLTMNGITKIDFSVTTDPGSYATDRFRIVFKRMIKFAAVNAACDQTDIDVRWKVEEAFDISHFEVERSSDGIHFTTIGHTASAANTKAKMEYKWVDGAAAPGIYYYRIKAIGSNAVTAYSDIAKVRMIRGGESVYVSPNPVTSNSIHLQMAKMPAGNYSASLTDDKGGLITKVQFKYAGGNGSYIIKPDAGLATGIYHVRLTMPGNKETVLKVLVQ